MNVTMLPISSLGKVFTDEAPINMPLDGTLEGFQNETISFQVAFTAEGMTGMPNIEVVANVNSPIKQYLHVRRVMQVPVRIAALQGADDYLRTEAGFYPDLLRNVEETGLRLYENKWEALWIDVEPAGKLAAGTYPVTVELLKEENGEKLSEVTVEVTVLPGMLPDQTLRHTKWLHCDCIAQYYKVEMFSEEFFAILRKFVRCAVRRGINMILTPIHTPPLDTKIGGERLTAQLVDVCVKNGAYSFGFVKLERFVKICLEEGVQYFEMAHLFTQWGATKTPKIMAKVDGEYKRIFGWDVDADSREYAEFLGAYLPALTAELKKLGIAGRTYFHISDEPSFEHLESYKKAKNLAAKYLEGFEIIDALSNFEFYKTGALTKPVPAINHIDPFIEANVPGLWAYYCIGQYIKVSNMFMAMPSYRNRVLGAQLYKYNIEGFLQWGFNFYNSCHSTYAIDPYQTVDADGWTPAGDAFQVYPGKGGEPEESLRMMVTAQALFDLRAMQLLERLKGREFVLSLIEEGLETPMTFSEYPHDEKYVRELRKRVNKELLLAMQ